MIRGVEATEAGVTTLVTTPVPYLRRTVADAAPLKTTVPTISCETHCPVPKILAGTVAVYSVVSVVVFETVTSEASVFSEDVPPLPPLLPPTKPPEKKLIGPAHPSGRLLQRRRTISERRNP